MSQEYFHPFKPQFPWLEKYYKKDLYLSPIDIPPSELADTFITIDSAYDTLKTYRGRTVTFQHHRKGTSIVNLPDIKHSLINSLSMIVSGSFTPAILSHESFTPQSEEFFLFLEGPFLHILYAQTSNPHAEAPAELPFIDITWHKRNPSENIFEKNSSEAMVIHQLAFYIQQLQTIS